VAGLRLEAVEFVDLTRWRWVLTDDSGALIAHQEVRLDASCWQFEAFADLTGYLSWRPAPDRRVQDEAAIVAELGEWIGAAVFGAIAGALVQARPVTVRVVVPAGAEELLARPLELAHVGGKPLAVQDVTLVMETDPGNETDDVAPVGERLRVLGLFSLPEGRQPLNLRRERSSLIQLIERMAADGKAVNVRALQYGVTRERLRAALEEAEGWDIVHISGHGHPGQLLLETDEGKQDRVSAAQLADLLAEARGRLKLVTISACSSAAPAVAEQRRLLGLPAEDEAPVQDRAAPGRAGSPDAAPAPGSLATELARRLHCAVLAMRYPVTDEFAIALSRKLYELLARRGQPLPDAVGTTLRELSSRPDGTGPGSTEFPALSIATPALFGGSAARLRLAAPDQAQTATNDAVTVKMTGFPPQPDRFVGRTMVMRRASAALAAQSGVAGVVLHGMPGGGKSACALELAYGHEHAFDQLIWHKAPDDGMDITGTLTSFARTLERHLDGFQMARRLTHDVLNVAQGHPKLIELAEGQAADPERLARLVEAGGQAWRARGGLPGGFFTTREPTAAGDADYLSVLATWTNIVAGMLAPGEQDFFWFLCCLEESDRERHMLDGNWTDLWTRLKRDGEPPPWEGALASLIACGLTFVREGAKDYLDAYPVHPGVAAAGRAAAGGPIQEAVDEEAAAYWVENFRQASGDTAEGVVLTDVLVRAGLAGVPYLVRRQRWAAAALLVETALLRNPSRSNAAAMMPAITQITGHDPSQGNVLARALEARNPDVAGSILRASLDAQVQEGDYWAAAASATQLMYHFLNSGRLAQALAVADQAISHVGQADTRPWTRMLAEIQRLQVCNAMGQYDHVLTEVQRLRERMLTLPFAFNPDEPAPPWDVREKLLDTGRHAERKLGRWDSALGLSREIITSMHGRRAPAAEIAKAAFNCYEPLLELGRTDESLALLQQCRHEFQQANDVGCLGMTMGALAEVENRRNRGNAAIILVRDGLRYTYMAGDVTSIAVSYHYLGGYLRDHARQSGSALSCHLAAALILTLVGAANSDVAVYAAAMVFELPRVSRTGKLRLIHAASCSFRYSSMTSCGVR
jgi:hypothetical protein